MTHGHKVRTMVIAAGALLQLTSAAEAQVPAAPQILPMSLRMRGGHSTSAPGAAFAPGGAVFGGVQRVWDVPSFWGRSLAIVERIGVRWDLSPRLSLWGAYVKDRSVRSTGAFGGLELRFSWP